MIRFSKIQMSGLFILMATVFVADQVQAERVTPVPKSSKFFDGSSSTRPTTEDISKMSPEEQLKLNQMRRQQSGGANASAGVEVRTGNFTPVEVGPAKLDPSQTTTGRTSTGKKSPFSGLISGAQKKTASPSKLPEVAALRKSLDSLSSLKAGDDAQEIAKFKETVEAKLKELEESDMLASSAYMRELADQYREIVDSFIQSRAEGRCDAGCATMVTSVLKLGDHSDFGSGTLKDLKHLDGYLDGLDKSAMDGGEILTAMFNKAFESSRASGNDVQTSMRIASEVTRAELKKILGEEGLKDFCKPIKGAKAQGSQATSSKPSDTASHGGEASGASSNRLNRPQTETESESCAFPYMAALCA